MVSWDEFFKKPRRIIAAVLVVAAVVGGFALAYAFGDIIFYLFVGVVLATALNPAVEAIQRCGIRRPIAVALVYACIAWALLVVTIGGAPPWSPLPRRWPMGFPTQANVLDNGWPTPGTEFGQKSPGELWPGFRLTP